MRPVLIFILLTFTTICVFGQDNVNKKKMVEFGCYYAGQPTKTVEEITELLLKKKYKTISDLLKSGHGGEKFLATVSLEKLAALGQYELSNNEKELILRFKSLAQQITKSNLLQNERIQKTYLRG
jgi:hypothetical protein